MGDNSYTSEIVRDGKTLILFAANLKDDRPTTEIENIATEAFEKLSKLFKEEKQVLYIRDTHELRSKSELFWSISYTDTNEATIGMPRWGDDETQIENLTFAINQALYVLVRRQHVGASNWFGAEVLSRGFSAYYAETVTGYECPLRLLMRPDRFRRLSMARHWIRPYETHYGRWKPEAVDLWNATSVGLEIAKLLSGDDDPLAFCLEEGISWHGFGSSSLLWVLNHPKRKRSARILEGKALQPRLSLTRLISDHPF